MDQSKKVKDIEALKVGYTKFVRIFEIFSILTYSVLAVWFIYIVKDFVWQYPFQSLLYVFGAWVLSDFITGFLHWLFDTWGEYDWPILGKFFVRPFLEHHISPIEITKHDWVETNGSNFFIGVLILGGTLYFTDSYGFMVFALFLSFWGSLTNQFHKWSHLANPNKWVVMLQKTGIILSKENHSKHHKGEFTEHYCITNGFLNSFLDKIAFFRLLEWLIQKATGKRPRDNDLP